MATAYYEKDFYNRFEGDYRKIIAEINAKPIQSEVDYLDLNRLNHQLFFNQRSVKHIPSPPDLWQCSEQLEHFYWLSKLKYACEWHSRSFITKEKSPDFIKLLVLPKKYINTTFPLHLLYYNIYSLFSKSIEDNEPLFIHTTEILKTQVNKLPLEENTLLLMYLINHAINGTRIDDSKYDKILFSLYKLGVSSKALFWKNQLSENPYLNIVYAGSTVGEYDWVTNFIDNYHGKLNAKTKDLIRDFALSVLDFYQQNYENAFYRLENIRFDDFTREISKKMLQIRSGFECFLVRKDFFQILISKSDNFNKMLYRKKGIETTKKNAYSNFNTTIKNIAILINKNAPKKEFIEIRAKINNQKIFLGRSWIINHLNEIIKQNKKVKAAICE